MEESIKKAILCAIHKQGDEEECMTSLQELERLLDTAGGEAVAYMTQMRDTPDNKTMFGSGKVAELSDMCDNLEADLVVFDCELAPSQIREIENAISRPVQVIDRSMLILDIFADHARTAEGRLQVELAQLRYTAPRLVGKGKELSRLGGAAKNTGIGSRGPGETKLEIDRRRIREKITALEGELEKNRQVMRSQRQKAGTLQCAIVGYTNAGKSTLLNTLTGAGILAEDKLFATLDTTTKQYELPGGTKILLTDTVGFIRNLPHHLIKAFRSTLEEVRYADMLLVVVDASDPECIAQVQVTTELLTELGAGEKPTLFAFNKCDAGSAVLTAELRHDFGLTEESAHEDVVGVPFHLLQLKQSTGGENRDMVFISAKTGAGLAQMIEKLEGMAGEGKKRVHLFIPPSEGAVTGLLYQLGDDVEMDYRADGIYCTVTVDDKLYGKIRKYITDPQPETDEDEEA